MNIDLKVMKESLPGFTVQSIASKALEGCGAKIIYEEAQKIAAEISLVAP